MLHLTGYELPLEQIQHSRQWGSRTPGHPERGFTLGVETTTGPLGQGSETESAWRSQKPTSPRVTIVSGFEIVDHLTYGIVSDGDLMEGVAAEAASIAGHLKLGKLIYLYDNNHISLALRRISLSRKIAQIGSSPMAGTTQTVEDGNDVQAIDQALRAARGIETTRPSLVLMRRISATIAG